MDRDKFTFFRSYFEAFSELPDELRLQCYDIVCEYALNGKEPEVEGIIKAIWKLIEPTVSKGIKMSDNGRRGGAPSGNNNAKSEEPEEAKQEPNDNQTESKNNQTETKSKPNLKQKQPNDNQTEKSDNQKTTGIGKGIGKGIGNGIGNGNGIGIGTDKQPNPKTTEPNHESSPDNVPYIEVVDAYNDFCPSLPRCTKLTDQRKKHIKARLKNNSIDSLKQAFLKAEESDFLAGRSGDWQADLNWIIKSEDNLTKILEGNYDNRNKSAQNSRDRPFSYMQFAGGEST